MQYLITPGIGAAVGYIMTETLKGALIGAVAGWAIGFVVALAVAGVAAYFALK